MTGVASRKAKRAASSWVSPRTSPATIVTPLRLIPARSAALWATPTPTASTGRSVLTARPCSSYVAGSRRRSRPGRLGQSAGAGTPVGYRSPAAAVPPPCGVAPPLHASPPAADILRRRAGSARSARGTPRRRQAWRTLSAGCARRAGRSRPPARGEDDQPGDLGVGVGDPPLRRLRTKPRTIRTHSARKYHSSASAVATCRPTRNAR